ncbi:MAG: hypothetical protein AB7G80_05060 [Dongiaceae bacterium]
MEKFIKNFWKIFGLFILVYIIGTALLFIGYQWAPDHFSTSVQNPSTRFCFENLSKKPVTIEQMMFGEDKIAWEKAAYFDYGPRMKILCADLNKKADKKKLIIDYRIANSKNINKEEFITDYSVPGHYIYKVKFLTDYKMILESSHSNEPLVTGEGLPYFVSLILFGIVLGPILLGGYFIIFWFCRFIKFYS